MPTLQSSIFLHLLNCTFLCWVHLIEGIIDQVEGTVHVSWVQPRVLGIPQIKSLRDRLDSWVDKVHTALLSVEAETPDLVAA
ncbi:26S proteasome non-ATPase regulatory subunit 13 -like protein B [Capsicum chinense]|nr:26S proteasome non-ATPase regulatory subunit 13 -like protein B [Capsicum chinense]